MPEIKVAALTNVLIDGVPSGSVTDVIMNHDPKNENGFRSSLLNALTAWHESCQHDNEKCHKESCDNHTAELAELKANHDQIVAHLKQQSKDELAKNDEYIAGLRASHEASLENQAGENQKLLSKAEEQIKLLETKLAEQDSLIKVLGGTEKGQELAREARRAALLKAKADADAELATL